MINDVCDDQWSMMNYACDDQWWSMMMNDEYDDVWWMMYVMIYVIEAAAVMVK